MGDYRIVMTSVGTATSTLPFDFASSCSGPISCPSGRRPSRLLRARARRSNACARWTGAFDRGCSIKKSWPIAVGCCFALASAVLWRGGRSVAPLLVTHDAQLAAAARAMGFATAGV